MLYAFALTSSLSMLLYKLSEPDCCYIVYSNNIDHYLNLLLHDQPRFILGMGVYSGVDQEVLRIETVTTNQFRNSSIESNIDSSEKLVINPFVRSIGDSSKLASSLGNSWCNLISWKIMQLINQKKLNSQYTFLHIPRTYPLYKSKEIIEEMLKTS